MKKQIFFFWIESSRITELPLEYALWLLEKRILEQQILLHLLLPISDPLWPRMLSTRARIILMAKIFRVTINFQK